MLSVREVPRVALFEILSLGQLVGFISIEKGGFEVCMIFCDVVQFPAFFSKE
jgi:hypothetical protein